MVSRRAVALAALAAGIAFIHLGLLGLDHSDVVLVDEPAALPASDEAVAHY